MFGDDRGWLFGDDWCRLFGDDWVIYKVLHRPLKMEATSTCLVHFGIMSRHYTLLRCTLLICCI